MSRDEPIVARIADALEGLLPAAEARALEARLAAEPALAARREALVAVLAEPVVLPPLAPPADLLGRALARLETEAARLEGPLPDSLLAERLEGLLAPEEADLVDQAAAADPEVAARLRALRDILGEREALPPVALPARLADRVAAALAGREPALDDATLAELVEGLLPPEQAARLEAIVASSPALGARRETLRAAFDEPARLPALTPPAGLVDRTLARLAEEGAWIDEALTGDDPPAAARLREDDGADLAPPAGLLEATLARLEAEGLVGAAPAGSATAPAVSATAPAASATAPAASATPPAASAAEPSPAPAGLVTPFPAVGGDAVPSRRGVSVWAAAAAALLAAAAGLALGSLAPGPGAEQVAALEELVRRSNETLHGAESRRAEVEASLREARQRAEGAEAASRAAEQAARDALAREQSARVAEREQAASAAARLGELELALAEARAASEARARELVAARRDLEASARRASAAEAALAATCEALSAREQALAAAEAGRAEAERRLAEAARVEPPGGGAALVAALSVDAAHEAERWDPALGAWVPLDGGALPAGTLVRGRGGASALTAGARRFALRQATYVVREGRIEPIPGQGGWQASGQAAPGGAPHSVPELIEALASGSPRARARAEHELIALFHRVPEPSAEAPPTTTRGWEAWWSRTAPTLIGALAQR